MPTSPLFPAAPRARSDLSPGSLYAIGGPSGYLYYGQVAPNKQLGFFRIRTERPNPTAALGSQIMSRFGVALPSIGRALRTGHWLMLGRQPLHPNLRVEPVTAQWPVGALAVTLWQGTRQLGRAEIADPKIQELEVIAAYDAVLHVPERLASDFDQVADAWRVGGSVYRHRLLAQDRAARFPDQPWHKLPPDWVPAQ